MISPFALNQAAKAAKGVVLPPRARTVNSCNFRYAGRLSNENARSLNALHEKFAASVTNSLELYLGASLRLKLAALEQMTISEYSSRTPASSFLAPCSLNVMESNILLEMDIDLIFPSLTFCLAAWARRLRWHASLRRSTKKSCRVSLSLSQRSWNAPGGP